MAPTTTPQRPSRLPRDPASNTRRVGKGLAALLGGLLLLVGIPVGLVLFVGNPLPTTPPSAEWLTVQMTPTLIIKVLGVLVWIVWTHFVVCFLTEWQAIRAGRMPGRVALGGGSQLLARKVVAGILLLSGGAAIAQGVTAASTAPSVEPTGPTSSLTTQALASALDQKAPAGDTAQQDDGQQQRVEKRQKFYEVKPPQGRNHDTLWDISERLLGDPLRYKEIYELNKGSLQPDGSRLTDADLIKPGWQLVLPHDASGQGVRLTPKQTTPPPAPTAVETAAQTGAQAGGQTGADVIVEAGGSQVDVEASDGAGGGAEVGGVQDGSQVPWFALGGGLILAGVLRALTAKRGPFGEPSEDAIALGAAANLKRARFLDLALRSLAESREAQALPMPDLQFAYAGDDQVVLHLDGDAPAPSAPWVARDDQTSWSLRAADLVEPSAGVAAPYPSLVNVGETHGFDILVDLETAPGMVALCGDDRASRDLATAMALDLTTHAWSDRIEVVMVGFGDHLVDLDTDRARRVSDLDAFLVEAAGTQQQQSRVLAELGVSGLLQGRSRGGARRLSPSVVFLSGAPTSEQAQRLAALTAGGRTTLSVVCVGDSPSARWRFLSDADGRLEIPSLGLRGTSRRLDVDAQRALRSLLAEAAEQRGAGEEAFENSSPAVLAAQALAQAPAESVGESAADPDAAPAAPSPVDGAPAAVQLLGPIEVRAAGHVDPARRDLLTEVVTMAALHPDGVHEAVLRSSLWPRGVEDDVVSARLSDAQQWLGHGPDGAPLLAVADGRVRLHPAVAVDYRWLLHAAQANGPDELDRLLEALRLGRGEAFGGQEQAYHWLAFAREARQCRLVVSSVARRAADLAVAAGDTARATEALELGLVLVPTSEALWRTLLRLTQRHDPGRVPAQISRLYSALDGYGVQHEPETEALVNELAPQTGRAAGA